MNKPGFELERLRSSLPMTTDGVTVVPGMYVYYFDPHLRAVVSTKVWRVSRDSWEQYDGGQPYYIRDKTVPYFSTKQVAHQRYADRLRKELEEFEKTKP